jgi:hypothetical protein
MLIWKNFFTNNLRISSSFFTYFPNFLIFLNLWTVIRRFLNSDRTESVEFQWISAKCTEFVNPDHAPVTTTPHRWPLSRWWRGFARASVTRHTLTRPRPHHMRCWCGLRGVNDTIPSVSWGNSILADHHHISLGTEDPTREPIQTQNHQLAALVSGC